MKKTVSSLIVIAIIVLVTWNVKGNYYPTVKTVVETDTTYVDRPYTVTEIKEVEKPVEVIRYETITDTIQSVKMVTDTVFVNTRSAQYAYHSSFLTQYPSAHKFLGLQYKGGDLSLTTQSPQGVTDTKRWDVGSSNYKVSTNVNIRTSPQAFSSDYSASAGWLQWYDEGSPYIEATAEFKVLWIPLQTTVNINKNPFIKAGVQYEF